MLRRPLHATLACLLTALALALGVLAPTSANPSTWNLFFVVLDPVTDNGVGGLVATPHHWDGTSWQTASDIEPVVTDPSGQASFDLPDGRWIVTFEDSRDRYVDVVGAGYPNFPDGPDGRQVQVIDAVNTNYHVTFRLEREMDLGLITGRLVTGPDAEPYVGSFVYAAREVLGQNIVATRSGGGAPLHGGGPVVAPGVFSLAVEPGEHFVTVHPFGDSRFERLNLPDMGSGFDVAANEVLDLGDIQMRPAATEQPEGYPVSVQVEYEQYSVDSDDYVNIPIEGIDLTLYRWDAGSGWVLTDEELPTTDAQGQASFEIFEQGDYSLGYADPAGQYFPGFGLGGEQHPTEPGAHGTIHVDGFGGGGHNLYASLRRVGEPGLAHMSAEVTTRGGDPVAGPILVAYRWDGESWIPLAERLGSDDGSISRPLNPGTYTFRFLRAGMQPVFLGGSPEMPTEPTAENSVVVGDDLAPVDLGTVRLVRQPTSFGTPIAG